MKKIILTILVLIIVVGGALIWWQCFFVFGEGVKAGNLNLLVKKGYIFKTWEGRLIQEGFKTQTPGIMHSNEFDFCIEDESVAKLLERSSGKFVELRYREYLRAVPWRGMSKYVVYDVLTIENSEKSNTLPIIKE